MAPAMADASAASTNGETWTTGTSPASGTGTVLMTMSLGTAVTSWDRSVMGHSQTAPSDAARTIRSIVVSDRRP